MGKLTFANKEKKEVSSSDFRYKILVVDDDPEVKSLTERLLKGYTHNGFSFEIYGAENNSDGEKLMEQHPDMAITILDAILPGELGFELARVIKNKQKNKVTRIIGRTGESKQVSELEAAEKYGVLFWTKQALQDPSKFKAIITTSLDTYDVMRESQHTIKAMQRINTLYETVLGKESPAAPEQTYSPEILTELREVLCDKEPKAGCSGFVAYLPSVQMQPEIDPNAIYADFKGKTRNRDETNILSALGSYESKDKAFRIPDDVISLLAGSCEESTFIEDSNTTIICVKNPNKLVPEFEKTRMIYCLTGFPKIDESKKQLLDMFVTNVFRVYEGIWSI